MKLVMTTASLAAALTLAACSGGGGGNTGIGGLSVTQTSEATHDQMATSFLTALQADNSNITYNLVKTDTQQSGYAVYTDGTTFFAVDVDAWNGTEDADTYVQNSGSSYLNLTSIGNNVFQDPVSGTLFQAFQPTSKDLEKAAAFAESLKLSKVANRLQSYGFSEDRSLEVAKLASQLAKAPKGSMTDADYDNFSRQITGSTMTQIKAALVQQAQGEPASLSTIIDTAAKTNGVGAEQMKQVLNTITNGAVSK